MIWFFYSILCYRVLWAVLGMHLPFFKLYDCYDVTLYIKYLHHWPTLMPQPQTGKQRASSTPTLSVWLTKCSLSLLSFFSSSPTTPLRCAVHPSLGYARPASSTARWSARPQTRPWCRAPRCPSPPVKCRPGRPLASCPRGKGPLVRPPAGPRAASSPRGSWKQWKLPLTTASALALPTEFTQNYQISFPGDDRIRYHRQSRIKTRKLPASCAVTAWNGSCLNSLIRGLNWVQLTSSCLP